MSLEDLIQSKIREYDGESVVIHRRLVNRHSRAVLLGRESGPTIYFAKFDSHFSGGHAWDARAEFRGYEFAARLADNLPGIRCVRPILVHEAPAFIVCEYVSGRPLHALYQEYLRGDDREGRVLELTARAAQWTGAYARGTETYSAARNSGISFLADRLDEMQGAGGGLAACEREACLNFARRHLTESVLPPHGDYGPHNILVDEAGSAAIIDIGFQTQEHASRFDDACDFILYLERMRLNPFHAKDRVSRLLNCFQANLVGERDANEFSASYIKKTAAHAAWYYNPKRKRRFSPGELVYRLWTRGAADRIRTALESASRARNEFIPAAKA